MEEWAPPESFMSKEHETRPNQGFHTANVTASSVDARTMQSYAMITENTQMLLDSLQRPSFPGKSHLRSHSQIQKSAPLDPLLELSIKKSLQNEVVIPKGPSYNDTKSTTHVSSTGRPARMDSRINLQHAQSLQGDTKLDSTERSGLKSSARDRSVPESRIPVEDMKTPERDRNKGEGEDTSPSLSPMGINKFSKLANKNLFTMNSRESLHGSSRPSVTQNNSMSVALEPFERIKEPQTSDRYSSEHSDSVEVSTVRFDPSTPFSPSKRDREVQPSSQRQKDQAITQSPGKTESSLPTSEINHTTTNASLQTHEDMKTAKPVTVQQVLSTQAINNYEKTGPESPTEQTLKVLVFNGGPFFPSKQTKSHRTPLVLTENEILNRFRELEEDIKPHFDIVMSPQNTAPVLYLDKSRTSIMKPIKSKVNPFDSISSYMKNHNYDSPFGTLSDDIPCQFRPIIERQLTHRFRFIHSLPFTDAFGSKGEYYLVTSKEDQSILLLKALLPGEISSENHDTITALFFKLADSTLSQLIDAQRRSHGKFKVSELRSLFHDCMTSLYTLQKEEQNLISLHPDFILFDQDNQVFYVLPVAYPTNYDPKNPNTSLLSLKHQTDIKQTGASQITPILGYRDYMSPLLRQSFESGYKECEHNPNKSCLFSLGLILLEALTLSSIEGFNQSKVFLYQLVAQYPLYITSSIIGKNYLVRCPNILRVLLNYEEEERPDFILLYFRVFTDLPVFEDPLHPKLSPPIFDNHLTQQLQLAKKLGSVKVTLSFTKGQKYIGQVKEYNGQVIRHGYGSFYNEQGDLIFQGTWDQDFPKQGVFIYNDDYRYEGTWSGFYHDGQGILYYRNTPLYEGAWRGFKYHEHGKLYYANGSVKYEGDFKLSMRHGSGKSYHPSGNVSHFGAYKEDKMNGQGALYWPSGEVKFEGEVLHTELDALYIKGTYYEEAVRRNMANIYVGELYNDAYHGEGILYDSHGNVLAEGQWTNGELKPAVSSKSRKNVDIPSYSSVKEENELVGELKLDCILNTTNVNQESQEMEVYLDFHAKNDVLHVDCTRLDGQHIKTAFTIIAKNPHFRLVKTLTLSKLHDQRTCTDFKVLMESENLSSLRELSIVKTNQLSNNLLKILADAPFLPSIEEISIIDSGSFSEEGLRALFSHQPLKNLQMLRIKNPTGIKDRGIVNTLLSSAGQLEQLRKLSLVQCFLGAESIKALFSSSHILSSVEELNLSRNQVSSKGCQYMKETGSVLKNLQRLNLKGCGIETPGVSFLVNSPFLSSVRSLNLSQNAITNASCDYICASRYLENVERLVLKNCGLGLQGIMRMSERLSARNILVLELDNNKGINNECMEFLAESECFIGLEEISMVGDSVTAKGVMRLCESTVLKRLRVIKVFGGETGKAVGKEVKKRMQIKRRMEII